MDCYYCKMNKALESEVVNSHHGEIHPTCAVCEYDFELMRADEKRFQLVLYLSMLLFLSSVIGFFSKTVFKLSTIWILRLSRRMTNEIASSRKRSGFAMTEREYFK